MTRETLNQSYFSWLYGLIRHKKRGYKKLCYELHQKKFFWSVHNDDNRCEDGLNLRDLFIDKNNLDETHLEVRYFLKGDCTVFELLVALAQRMNELMYDLEHQEDHTSKWFLEMLRNLKLTRFTDKMAEDERFDPVTEAFIDDTLETFMHRSYDFNGSGGLFPLKKRPRKDQSTVEIWYQLMSYMDENYGL